MEGIQEHDPYESEERSVGDNRPRVCIYAAGEVRTEDECPTFQEMTGDENVADGTETGRWCRPEIGGRLTLCAMGP